MRIDVTQKHINKGQKCSCHRCPVALAVQEATGDMFAQAGPAYIFISGKDGNLGQRFKTPDTAGVFMTLFDSGIVPVIPFSFFIPYGEAE